MTTIVIDFQNKMIIADRQQTCTRLSGFTKTEIKEQTQYRDVDKIHTLRNGYYATGAGDSDEIRRQIAHINCFGVIDPKVKSSCILAVVRDKGLGLSVDIYRYKKTKWTWFTGYGEFKLETIQKTNGILSFGSGSDYAFGAYMAGASPKEAVKVAAICDKYTGHEIDCVSVVATVG